MRHRSRRRVRVRDEAAAQHGHTLVLAPIKTIPDADVERRCVVLRHRWRRRVPWPAAIAARRTRSTHDASAAIALAAATFALAAAAAGPLAAPNAAVARVATHTATRLPRAAGHPERSAGLCLRRDAVGGPHASLHGRRVAPARRPGVHARRHGGQLAWRRLCKHTRIDGGCRGSHWQLHGRRLAVRPHRTINRRRDASRRVVANLAGHGVWCGERRGQWRLRDCARLLKGARRGADRRHQRRCAHRAQHGAHKPHLRDRAAAEPQHACIQPQNRRHLLARLRERRGARGFTALATAQPALAPTVPTRHTRALSGALTTPSTIISDTAVVVVVVAATFAAAAAAAS